ncbi:MAG: hypothetical protein HZC05_00015 [Candidatus Magasanikbacteria bacterium]|nr:hypothetical protein [Candidatus Magasanikbacteria bacterium]
MTKINNGAVVENLLQKLRVAKVKWTADGRLLIGLVCGQHSWGQLRQICDDKFAELAKRVKRVALDTGGEVLDCWWDVQAVCAAGFAPQEKGWEEEWEFVFQVKIPPGKQERSWMAPRRVAFVINGHQLIIKNN